MSANSRKLLLIRIWSVAPELLQTLLGFSFDPRQKKSKIMGVEETIPYETPITKQFLESLLKKPIQDFQVSGGSNPGDNFTSILISIEIRFPDKNEPIHLLYKTFPNHPTRQKLLEDTNLFQKEYQVYSTWIPELIRFQSKLIGNGPEKILIPAVPQLVAGAAIDYENGKKQIHSLISK